MEQINLSIWMKIRYRIEWVGIILISRFVRLLPLSFGPKIVGKLWRIFAPLTSRKRHTRAIANVKIAFPELNDKARKRIILEMWETLGRVLGETIQVDRIIKQHNFTFETSLAAKQLKDFGGNGGCVLISAHLTNWELSIMPALNEGWEACGVYQAVKNPYVEDYLYKLRLPQFKAGLYHKSSRTGWKLVSKVRDGNAAACLADHRDIRGIKVNFFGKPAFATTFPIYLALTQNVPVISCRAIRRSDGGFDFQANMIEIPRDGDFEQNIAAGTQIIHDLFEKWIREDPSQWMWIHGKWDYA